MRARAAVDRLVRSDVALLALVPTVLMRLGDDAAWWPGPPVFKTLVLAFGCLVVIGRWKRFGSPMALLRRPLPGIGAWMAVCGASILVSQHRTRTLGELLILAQGVVVCLVVVCLVWNARAYRRTLWVLLGTGAVMGAITIHRFTTESWDLAYFGLDMVDLQDMSGTSQRQRATGPIGDPNYFAQFLCVLIALAVERLWNARSPAVTALAAGSLFLSTGALAFTFSRGGYLSLMLLVLAYGVVAAFWRPDLRRLVATAGLMVAALALGGETARVRAASLLNLLPGEPAQESVEEPRERPLEERAGADYGFRGRASENLAALLMFTDHPVLGVGFGTFSSRYAEYASRIGIDERPRRDAHNLYLEIAAETGLLGIAAFLYFTVTLLRGLWAASRRVTAAGDAELGRAIGGMLMAVLAYSAAAVTLHLAYRTIFWMLVGVAFGAANLACARWDRGEADSSEIAVLARGVPEGRAT